MSRINTYPSLITRQDRHCRRAAVVVYRRRKKQIEFLLVSRRSDPDQFVLPAGHAGTGESLREAAARECLEEAGVTVQVFGPLVRYTHTTARGHTKPTMAFLGEAIDAIPSPEGREVIWARLKQIRSGEVDVPMSIADVLEYALQCLQQAKAA